MGIKDKEPAGVLKIVVFEDYREKFSPFTFYQSRK